MVAPSASIQAAVQHAPAGAVFCLENGIYRGQTIRPKSRQSFYGEGKTILNGSRIVTGLHREGAYWVADWQGLHAPPHGMCDPSAPACNIPEGVFLDGRPLRPVSRRDLVEPGRFYLDRKANRVFLGEDPAGHVVEETVASVAFEGTAPFVSIKNITIEEYGSSAEQGAIQAQTRAAHRWTIEDCEVRLNSGGGIAVGEGSRVSGCAVHENGQIGITGVGDNTRIERNEVWNNNTRSFNYRWEAGGIKLTESAHAVFSTNHVYHNAGPGIWCDINCRDVVIENNIIERNQGAGIVYEISLRGSIRHNLLQENGLADRTWFGGINILVAGSEQVDIEANRINVQPDGCGIVLLDQDRAPEGTRTGSRYQTRENLVKANLTSFAGSGCAGGISDLTPNNRNRSIITAGHNSFDSNIYRLCAANARFRFLWGNAVLRWGELSGVGQETHGTLQR